MEMNGLARDGAAKPVSQDQILRRERGQRIFTFPCSADHEQDWQPYPVDPHPCYMCETILLVLQSAEHFATILVHDTAPRLPLPSRGGPKPLKRGNGKESREGA